VIQCYFILDRNFYAIYIEEYFAKLKKSNYARRHKGKEQAKMYATKGEKRCSLDKVWKGEQEVVELEITGDCSDSGREGFYVRTMNMKKGNEGEKWPR